MNHLSFSRISRRNCLGVLAGAVAVPFAFCREGFAQPTQSLPPVRAITSGPHFHFFGYYDKFQFDVSGRYVLGLQVDFEHRLPQPDDTVTLGVIDLQDKDRWTPLGESRTWSWQQGCMLQWIPGSDTKVLWNDREKDRFVCRIFDVATREMQVIPHPIYTLHLSGRSAIVPDFRRLRNLRPDTGYAGVADPYADQQAPSESGISRVDLETGDAQLLLSFAEVANFGDVTDEMRASNHWIEHLSFNPDASRFSFLHRWRRADEGKGGFHTRMITASPDGKDLFVIDPSGKTSHTAWRDANHILAYTLPKDRQSNRRFCLFRDGEGLIEVIGEKCMPENGHCTYLTGGEWLLNDTYADRNRLQHPYLYHVPTNSRVALGHFHSPKEYGGPVRCDTHPRLSRDCRSVVIDSPHGGNGRQMYLIDISEIVG